MTLEAFTQTEFTSAHLLLASKVATMMGRKFEEADWSDVYCTAKGIPCGTWSNINIDISYGNLGVEHKMLCLRSGQPILNFCGTTQMHPSATRSIRIPVEENPTIAARNILNQYSLLIAERKAIIQKSSGNNNPVDLRTGWFLWQESLTEFLYFEEETIAPNPELYWAKWNEKSSGGSRKSSRNLWVYEESTGKKKFSITTQAGAKIQPYFDIPAPNDPNLYRFIVQGEVQSTGLIKIWLTKSTALFLNKILGSLSPSAIEQAVNKIDVELKQAVIEKIEPAVPVLISSETYQMLNLKLNGVSDEHKFQLLLHQLIQNNRT